MPEPRLPVTIVNHVAIDIAATPDTLWRAILEDYIGGTKFSSSGYVIDPLDEPQTPLGGYRMRLSKDGAVVDDRVVRVTERDDADRRLSIHADYLSIPGGFQVYVTYQAQPTADGCRYLLDCHTQMTLEPPDGDLRAGMAREIAKTKAEFDAALMPYFAKVKKKLEGGA